MADLRARLDLAPEDAVRFFAAKGEALSWDWHELRGDAHAHAFTVAKATSLDVLRVIRTQVQRAIEGGVGFADFKRTLAPQLQDMGWWGKADVLDAETGELKPAQLGSARRLRTIFQTNVQTAYMAGRYKRYLADVESRPYWRYVAIMDGRTRPAHAALHGKVYRWDDPIWQVIWPPNGWGCRCRVDALTEAQVRRLGLRVESGADAVVELQVPVGRDGDMVAVKGVKFNDAMGMPKVFRPDPGWDYNPGAAWARFDDGGHKPDAPADAAPAPSTLHTAAGQKTWAALRMPSASTGVWPAHPSQGLLAEPASANQGAAAVREALGLARSMRRTFDTPVGEVTLRPELLPAADDLARGLTARLAAHVVPTLSEPAEVWLTAYADGTYRLRYLAAFGDATTDDWARYMLVRVNRDGSLHWQAATDAATADAWRAGTLLYRRKGL